MTDSPDLDSGEFTLRPEALDDLMCLFVGGDLYFPHVGAFLEAIRGIRDQAIVVDLSGVDFIDSSGLGALLVSRRWCIERGASFVVRGVRESVRGRLQMAGVTASLGL